MNLSLPNCLAVTLLTLLFHIPHANAQLLLGGPDHQPGEVKADPVNEGSVSGDVNLFSGTYDLTQTLGTVSGINGPSFTLTASYSSVVATGSMVPQLLGYPLGEGWALNLPRITCTVEDFERYSQNQKDFVAGQRVSKQFLFYPNHAISLEKSLYFFNVNFSVPGVGSGKLVYKYTKGGVHHFTPQSFEQPLTVTLDGSIWTIKAPNGDTYKFGPKPSLRANGNLRVHKTRDRPIHHIPGMNDVYGYHSRSQEANIQPREAVTEWNCVKITNPSSRDAILFTNQAYGKFTSQFDNWQQEVQSTCRWEGGFPYYVPSTYYEGSHLTAISSSIERLDLEYDELNKPSEDSGSEDVDFAYRRTLVNGVSKNWKRFLHVAAGSTTDDFKPSDFSSSTNPYRHARFSDGYQYKAASIPTAFDHAFLESPQLRLANDGSYYRVEFDVSSPHNVLFDVNIVAGSRTSDTGTGVIQKDAFNRQRKTTIKSTFQDPMKYYVRRGLGDGDVYTFSATFLQPRLPHLSDPHTRIQIGPANSGTAFDADLTALPNGFDYLYNRSRPRTFLSYNHFPGGYGEQANLHIGASNNGKRGERITPGHPHQTDPVPSNFGVGLPWFNMLHLYNYELVRDGNPGLWLQNFGAQTGTPQFKKSFWWKRKPISTGNNAEWKNEPTLAGPKVKLRAVRLYRYTKKNLVLAAVKKSLQSSLPAGQAPTLADISDRRSLVAQTRFQYDIKSHFANANSHSKSSNKSSEDIDRVGTILLRRIVQVPINVPSLPLGVAGKITYPTTELRYTKADEAISLNFDTEPSETDDSVALSALPATLFPHYIISQHISPTGKQSTIWYKDYDRNDLGGTYLSHQQYYVDNYDKVENQYGNSTISTNYAYTANWNFVVDKVSYTDQRSDVFTDYKFSKLAAYTGATRAHKNLTASSTVVNATKQAFGEVSMTGPYYAKQRRDAPVSNYLHSTHPLLWGKLLRSTTYDVLGRKLSESRNDYVTTLAFEPGYLRTPIEPRDWRAYADYDHQRPAPPVNSPDDADMFKQYVRGFQTDTTLVRANELPHISAQYLYTPLCKPTNFTGFGIRNEKSYEELNSLFSESSFFVALESSTSVTYDYCDESLAINDSIISKEEFTYYSANYDGSFEAGTFGRLDKRLRYRDRLYHEPSFLLASKTSSSNAVVGSSREEYYYLWDLKNVSKYLSPHSFRVTDRYNQLSALTEDYRGISVRNLKIQTKTIFADNTEQSTFTTYRTRGLLEGDGLEYHAVENEINCIRDVGAGPPPPPPTTPGENCVPGSRQRCPNAAGCYFWQGSPLPQGMERQPGGSKMVCPIILRESEEDVLATELLWQIGAPNRIPTLNYEGKGPVSNYKNTYRIESKFSKDRGTTKALPEYLRNIPIVTATHVQVKPASQSGGLYVSYDEALDEPSFSVDVIKTYELKSRSYHNLPKLTEDQRKILTRYQYGPATYMTYNRCLAEGQEGTGRAYFSHSAGLPVSITKGATRPDSMLTAYQYDQFRRIVKVIDPNGIEATNVYDNFNRLASTSRNGHLLTEYQYNNYALNSPVAPADFNAARMLNFVSTTNHVNNSIEVKSVQRIDPLGRAAAAVSTYSTKNGNQTQYGAVSAYDIYGRTLSTDPNNANRLYLDSDFDKTDYATVKYAPAPSQEALQSARPGLPLLSQPSGHNKYNYTCVVSAVQLKGDVANTGNDSAIPYLPDNIKVVKSTTIDEDGKTYVSYTNGQGQTLASIGFNEGERFTSTVNKYNLKGQLTHSINPKGQVTSYLYNYLGLAYSTTSPDAGTTLAAYDISGNLISSKFSTGKQTSFRYDSYNRMVEQIDGEQIHAFEHEGLPWLSDIANAHAYEISDDIDDYRPEKLWQYDQSSIPANFTQQLSSNFSSQNAKHRLAAVYAYDQNGKPVQGTCFSYNSEGFIEQENTIFSNDSEEYLAYSIAYGEHDYSGTAKKIDVDVNNDGVDFTHRYVFDGLGRIEELYLSVPDLDIDDQLAASYGYDLVTGLPTETLLYSEAGEILRDEKTYDIAQRLKSISSPLFKETIEYDAGTNGYFNGNIYSITSEYLLEDLVGEQTMLSRPGTYVYTYDGLNRLTQADHTVDNAIFSAVGGVGNAEGLFGDVSYAYDKVGNLQSINRGLYLEGRPNIVQDDIAMTYVTGKNQLESVTQTFDPTTKSSASSNYSYFENGYLERDGRKNIDITYLRNTYPAQVGTDRFAYDVNDARIHKKGDRNEYYLRNAAGQELAIINFEDLTATWYAYGQSRLAEIPTVVGECGSVTTQEEEPGEDSEEALRALDPKLAEIVEESNGRFANDPGKNQYEIATKFASVHHNLRPGDVMVPSSLHLTLMPGNSELVIDFDPEALRVKYPDLEATLLARGFSLADLILRPNNDRFNHSFKAVVEAVLAHHHRGEGATPHLDHHAAFTHDGSSVGVTYIVRQPQPSSGPFYVLEPCKGNLTVKIVNLDGGVVHREPIPSATLIDHLSRTPATPVRSWYLDQTSQSPCVSINLPASLSNETLGNHVYTSPGDTTVSPQKDQSADPVTEKRAASASPINFYLTDHLGNTRVTFKPSRKDGYEITYAADYYPYGKVMRAYQPCVENRFLSTQHERDVASGYDNRGARLYDSGIGVFLGVDPLAGSFPDQSPYHYAYNNPLRFIDPDGRSADDVIVDVTGDANTVNEYVNIINDNLGGQFRASLEQMYDSDGNVVEGQERLRITATEGGGDVSKLSTGQQQFYNDVNHVAEVDRRAMYVKPVSGDGSVGIGRYNTFPAKVDVADIRAFQPLDPSKSVQNGATQAGKFIHEFMEQYYKQVVDGNQGENIDGYNGNHFGGVATTYSQTGTNGGATGREDAVNGNTRVHNFRYKNPDGAVYESYYGSKSTIEVTTRRYN